jgi:hypothetical protein
MTEPDEFLGSGTTVTNHSDGGGPPVDAGHEVHTVRHAFGNETVTLGILAALPILLLSPNYLLSHPYWLDESWVALTAKAPLSQLLMAAASAPIGWIGLMFLVPGSGDQHQRLLPLAFAVGTVIFAYLFARDLPWPTPGYDRIAGTVTALLVAIAPIALLRQDLKQYTADACITLLILWLVVKLEATWSVRGLRTLVVVSILGSLISYASMFVVAASFVALVIVAAIQHKHRRLVDTVIAGAVTVGGLIVVAFVFVVPAVSDALTDYWRGSYLSFDDGLWALVGEIWSRFDALAPLLGFKWASLAVTLGVVGIVVIARLGRLATALVLPLLYFEMVALGVLDKYPFLDQRTSHFLLLLTVAVSAVGISGMAAGLHARWGPVGSFALVGMIAFVFYAVSPFVGTSSIPNEDARSQAQYVETNFQSGDTILVNSPGRWAFAYYWDANDPVFAPNDRSATGYSVDYDEDQITIASGRTPPEIEDGLDAALGVASGQNASGRVWLVRSHMIASEVAAWEAVLDRTDIAVEVLAVGPEPLLLVTIQAKGDM